MKKKKCLPAVMTVLTAAACVALCVSVLVLYTQGTARRAAGAATEPIFTREEVARQMIWVGPILLAWLAAAVGAWALGRTERDLGRADQPLERTLALLRARVGLVPPEAEKERTLRRRIWIAGGVGIGLCAGWALLWLLNRENFTSWELERVMGEMLAHILPPLVLGFAALFTVICLCDRSRAREKDALLRAARGRHLPHAAAPLKSVAETGRLSLVRWMLLAAAAALIALGVINGGLNDVFVKAINICTGCIGLG